MVIAYILFVTNIRIKNFQIEELQTLNNLLSSEQESQNEREDLAAATVMLNADSNDPLEVCPDGIIYIESVANYVNIVTIDGTEISQHRLRCTLRSIEETLNDFPFIIHIHRAFLVNINFITHISGNAGGYKIQAFGTDKILPVSKANIKNFKERLETYADNRNYWNDIQSISASPLSSSTEM